MLTLAYKSNEHNINTVADDILLCLHCDSQPVSTPLLWLVEKTPVLTPVPTISARNSVSSGQGLNATVASISGIVVSRTIWSTRRLEGSGCDLWPTWNFPRKAFLHSVHLTIHFLEVGTYIYLDCAAIWTGTLEGTKTSLGGGKAPPQTSFCAF